MKERPIIFSGPMVRAILEGRKTQTRRVIKPRPDEFDAVIGPDLNGFFHLFDNEYPEEGSWELKCPYGALGDRLWVRETFAEIKNPSWTSPVYRATQDVPHLKSEWRPSIHMPRWASRITLEITNVRVERVQEISFADIEHEGLQQTTERYWRENERLDAWIKLWNSTNAKRGFGWDTNPWVWVIEFRKVKG